MKQQIYSAIEAKELTHQAEMLDDSDLAPIMEKIEHSAKIKDYYCYIYGQLHEYTINKLRKLGYEVTYHIADHKCFNENFYKIQWR